MIPLRQGAARACRIESGVLLLCILHALCSAGAEPRLPGNRKGTTLATGAIPRSAASGPANRPVELSDLRFTHLTSAEGLSHDAITAIIQDHRGFMWFATRDGLNRYDGNTFIVYKHNSNDPGSLGSNSITDLVEDDQGHLWIGVWPDGVDRFDPRAEKFVHYRHDPNNVNSISSDQVEGITRDNRGDLWFCTQGSSLDKFDPRTGAFTHYRYTEDGKVTHVLEDSRGEFWFVGERGLFHLNLQTGQITHPPGATDGLAADWVTEDDEGNLLLLSYSPIVGLVKYDRKAERLTLYPIGAGAVGIAHARLLADGEKGFWVPSSSGLLYFDRRTERFSYRFQHDDAHPDSLSDNSVVCAYRDRGGALWVGTEKGGLNLVNFEQEQFGSYRHRAGGANSLSPGRVTGIYEEPGGVLWIGLSPRALDRLDRRTGQFTHYAPRLRTGMSKGTDVNSICRDARGYLWLGGWNSGLDRFDERTGQFKHYGHNPGNPNSLGSDNILSIYSDRSGQLWVGHPNGIARFDPSTEQFTNFLPDSNASARYGNSVSVIVQDRSGTMWLGTWGGALIRFDDKRSTVVDQTDDPLSGKYTFGALYAIHEDRAGALWVGAEDGLHQYDPRNGTFAHYTESEGLPTNVVRGILEDNLGRLWLSTAKGLSRFDPKTHAFKNYDVSDGLKSNDFSQGCYQQSENGDMFFCASNGITTFFPENIRQNSYVPPVVITAFSIFNRPVPIGANSVLRESISYVNTLTLSYRDTVFSFEFAALSYANSQKNRYRYKLEGLEPGWNEVDSRRRLATYTNLSPGKYVFRVQGSNDDGVWNETGVSMAITITPPWWSTWWFRSLAALIAFWLLWSAYTKRLRKVEQRNVELAQQVAERTAAEEEIKELSERLINAQESERARIARELHDDFSQEIVGISLSLGTIRRELVDPNSEASEQMEKVRDNLNHLSTTIRELSHELHPAVLDYCDLEAALRTLCAEFTALTGVQTALECNCQSEGLPPSVALCIYRVTQEALRNVAKHAQSEAAQVRLERSNRIITLSVSDKGVGFRTDQARGSGGLGLISIKERVRLVKGTMELQSEPTHGTTLRIEVPISNDVQESARS